MKPPLTLLRGENGETLVNLRKAENDDIDDLKVRSVKDSKSLPECPTITALVAAFDVKSSMTRNCGSRAWVAGTQLLIFVDKPTEKIKVTYLTKQMAYMFYKFHISFHVRS